MRSGLADRRHTGTVKRLVVEQISCRQGAKMLRESAVDGVAVSDVVGYAPEYLSELAFLSNQYVMVGSVNCTLV